MGSNHRPHQKWLLFLLLVPVMILTALLAFSVKSTSAAPVKMPPGQQPDNSACLSCHQQEGQIKTFDNGELLSLTISPETYGGSIHKNLSCQVCHTNISGFPHPENTAVDSRDYTLQYKDSCKQCHPNQFDELMDSAHTAELESGNRNAPVCADCHNPHAQPPIQKNENGLPAPSEHANIAQICSQCHNQIYEEYVDSVHGAGVFVDKNPDVPACTDCHGIHSITGPSTTTYRLSSPQICAKCHTDETIMDKYGISTNVLNTYIADFHGTTVTLFEKTDPDQDTNKPVCYDCHGVHNIKRTDDPEKGLQVKENILVACQRCHPDATMNFPDSWLSHYIPSPTKYPLVYYVNLFYKIFIPTVIGGMLVFVASDVYRKFKNGKKKAVPVVVDSKDQSQSSTNEPEKSQE